MMEADFPQTIQQAKRVHLATLSQLEQTRAEAIAELNTHLLAKDYKQARIVKKQITLIENAIRLTVEKPGLFRRVSKPFAVGLLCLIVLWLGIGLKKSGIDFRGEFVLTGVMFTMSSTWQQADAFGARNISVSNLSTIDAPGFGILVHDKAYHKLRIVGDTAVSHLSDITLSDSARVTVLATPGSLEIMVKNDSITATVIPGFNAAVSTEVGLKKEKIVNASGEIELINLATHYVKEDAARFVFDGIRDWKFAKMDISNLRFEKVEQIEDATPYLVSTILSGKLTVLQTGKEYFFEESDVISFDDIKLRRISVVPDLQGMKIRFEGRAERVHGGIAGFEKVLNPSWAEYLYRQETIGFIYVCIGFLWTFFWGARSVLIKTTE